MPLRKRLPEEVIAEIRKRHAAGELRKVTCLELQISDGTYARYTNPEHRRSPEFLARNRERWGTTPKTNHTKSEPHDAAPITQRNPPKE